MARLPDIFQLAKTLLRLMSLLAALRFCNTSKRSRKRQTQPTAAGLFEPRQYRNGIIPDDLRLQEVRHSSKTTLISSLPKRSRGLLVTLKDVAQSRVEFREILRTVS